jgi:hypothetical protein
MVQPFAMLSISRQTRGLKYPVAYHYNQWRIVIKNVLYETALILPELIIELRRVNLGLDRCYSCCGGE